MYLMIIVVILIVNFVYNYRNYKLCDKHLNRFNKWLFEDDSLDLSKDAHEVIKLVKQAGFYDIVHPVLIPLGLGQASSTNIHPIDQYPSRRSDIAQLISRQLEKSRSVYRERMLFSINPFLWIDFVIYLPSKILNYLDIGKENFKKAANVIWWIANVIAIPILLNSYSEEVELFIKSFLDKFF